MSSVAQPTQSVVALADRQMRIGVMLGPGSVETRTVKTPTPGPGQVLVRLRATSICTWEQRTYSGAEANTFPFVGGHEMAGDVATLGPGVSDLAPGDRVALGPSSCGRCHWCLTGQERACREHYNVTVRYGDAWGPGGFAEYKLHPADGLFRIHDAPYEHAAMAEPLSCAIHAARLLDVAVGQDVVVLGAGVMGLLNVVALKKRGARVIVSEMDSSRLELARVMGADELVDASRSDPVASVRELTEGRGSEAVIAAIGNPEASEQALEMLAERGRYVVFASAHPERTLEIRPNRLHNHEQGVFGVVSKDKGDFYTAVRLIRYRQVDLSPLIQASFALTGLRDALELAVQPGTYRVIVTP